MAHDLTAPPKLSTRAFAKWTIGYSGLAVCGAVVYGFFDEARVVELVIRCLVIAGIGGAAIWLYARLMRAAANRPPEKMPLVHVAIGVVMWTAMFSQLAMVLPGFRTMLPWWQLPFMIGAMIIQAGWKRRVGNSLHCPACEYECKFDNPEDVAPRCSECGTPWLGRLRKGRVVRSPRLMAAGAALAILGFFGLSPIFYMRALAPHLPTPVLYSFAYIARDSYGCWPELEKRNLDSGWTAAMARHVMRDLNSRSYNTEPRTWLENTIAAGRLPQELADKYYAGLISAELAAPDHVNAGESFNVSLRVRRAASGRGCLGIWFAGYGTDGQQSLTGRIYQTVWSYSLSPDAFKHHRDVLTQTLTAGGRGEVRVHAVYWVVYLPSFSESLQWQPDGSPVPPPGALWFQRVQVEKTVRVD